MSFRLPARLEDAVCHLSTRSLSLCRIITFSILSLTLCCELGCVGHRASSLSVSSHRALDRTAAKLSFLSWNMRSLVNNPEESRGESTQSRAFRIASLSNRELYQLMRTRPAPDLATIAGKWNGINKGFGAAMIGLTQDVKVFEGQQCLRGYNMLVKQVSISDLPCRGWKPERDPKTCQPKTMGNFMTVAPNCCGKLGHTLKLDYTIAENEFFDPSKNLIDELVEIDHDILLGRANAKVGLIQIPVAYFVLMRQPKCTGNDVHAAETSNEPKHEVLIATTHIIEDRRLELPHSESSAASTASKSIVYDAIEPTLSE